MNLNQGNYPDSSTSYNISIESSADFDSIKQSCQAIENFIEEHKDKFQKSQIFKALIALHDLFKIEITKGIQLRQILFEERNINTKLHTELRSFYEIIEKQTNLSVNSISSAKNAILKNFQDNEEYKASKELEIASFTSKIDNLSSKNAELQSAISILQKQYNESKNNQQNMIKYEQYQQVLDTNNSLQTQIKNLQKENLEFQIQIQNTKISASTNQELQLQISNERQKNQQLIEKNNDLLNQVQNLSSKASSLESNFTPTIQKLQLDLNSKNEEISRLKMQIVDIQTENRKEIDQLVKENKILVASLSKTSNISLLNVFQDICKILNVPLTTKPEELPLIIERLTHDGYTSTYEFSSFDDSYIIGLRPLILVALTCNRLLANCKERSLSLTSEIENLKNELISARNHIEVSEI
ncbi:hypothetical protein TVAG_376250 [Trichomonas vaginalis G3]|uniref:Uncharacterized protein n=1 Tax=Trichomonas vaginalis (strain ATCC PRA-98 / G3) TaxID=412133 RepID=A2FWZ2_TRIV3|nr:hypothetical protein TVAGG3_0740850 [Trichomonas vaginalis G3]EAX90569.1 hypothetical protein TVAG_376250 [Trichomonas vaginalis G3]KAI5511874.1 hypothetical protein TVAGG3_0740850 [Trichomonas vaginalis G3]|eukprot:XP_001303499.1 hypothetical protein [Trichomonas vaginalis G3]